MLLKSSIHLDTSLPSYGSIHFKQKNCQEENNSDVTCNQFFLYKTPSLADDAYQGKSMTNCDKSLTDNSVSCNKRNRENQHPIEPISSVLSTLGADKNGVAMEPIEKR
jgi:hypothetical protein